MRRLPRQGARHGTVDHGDASDGVFFLLHLWVLPSSWVILLWRSPSSLSSLRMASRFEWWRLHEFRVEGPSGARKGGLNRPLEWARPAVLADRPRPIPAWFGRPFSPVGPCVFVHFASSTCTILTMSSSRPWWRFSLHEVRSFTLQSSGMFLCNTSVLATIGSDFIKLINTNKTP
jgi:hypothetical protein